MFGYGCSGRVKYEMEGRLGCPGKYPNNINLAPSKIGPDVDTHATRIKEERRGGTEGTRKQGKSEGSKKRRERKRGRKPNG